MFSAKALSGKSMTSAVKLTLRPVTDESLVLIDADLLVLPLRPLEL